MADDKLIKAESVFGIESYEENFRKSQEVAASLMTYVKALNKSKANTGSVIIQGNEYLCANSWKYIGGQLGLMAKIVEGPVQTTPGGRVWMSKAELVKITTGVTVGSGAGVCDQDEVKKAGGTKIFFQAHAAASMSQTRAVSKAFQNTIGFIPQLAGFAGTPAEEMMEAEYSIVDDEEKKPEGKDESQAPPPPPAQSEDVKGKLNLEQINTVQTVFDKLNGTKKGCTRQIAEAFGVDKFGKIPFNEIKRMGADIDGTIAKYCVVLPVNEADILVVNDEDGKTKYTLKWRKVNDQIEVRKSVNNLECAIYVVSADLMSCTCPGASHKKVECKHMKMGVEFIKKVKAPGRMK